MFGRFGGFWRVWRVLKGVEGLEGFGGFGGCLEGVWRVWRILERLDGFGGFGVFAGWQTAALKAHRKPLLWPWPWGACSGSGLGPGVPAGDGVWRVWKVLEGYEGLEGFGSLERLQAGKRHHRKLLLWPWPWGACWGSGLGPGVPALEGFGGWSDRTSSTPAVVPGAAPALAKAGVGGFLGFTCSEKLI